MALTLCAGVALLQVQSAIGASPLDQDNRVGKEPPNQIVSTDEMADFVRTILQGLSERRDLASEQVMQQVCALDSVRRS